MPLTRRPDQAFAYELRKQIISLAPYFAILNMLDSLLCRNQYASQVRHLEGEHLPVENQVLSNECSGALFSRPIYGEHSRTILSPEGGGDMAPSQKPQKHSLRSSTDEFIRASTLFPELEHPKKLFSESHTNCIRATALNENFDVQTPSQVASKKIFPGLAHGADTPLTGYGSDQTLLQHSSKKFSLVSANGEYTRAAVTTFGQNSSNTRAEEPSKMLCSESSDPLYIRPTNLFPELEANETPLKNHSKNSSLLTNGKYNVASATLFPELESSPLKPETPAMQAAIPHLKRVQEDQAVDANNQCPPLWALNKKMRSAHCSIERKDHDERADSARSKFEWLNPSAIRDANRRRLNDPLYDKSTLFIPPDALRKMSTSQKQYWNIKCKYMDVVLFFKVVRFVVDDSIHGM
jgi:DNA mismatch repair protein MSH6